MSFNLGGVIIVMANFLVTAKGRILLGIVLPPLIGALLFAVPAATRVSYNEFTTYFIFTIFLLAYLVMIIPSVLYSLVMEYQVNRRVRSDFIAIALSTLLGLIAGSVFLRLELLSPGVLLMVICAIAGAVVGIILRRCFNKDIANKALHRISLRSAAE